MPLLAGKDASAGTARAGKYARHRPEQAHFPAFVEHVAVRERTLPAAHVQREFEDYLKWRLSADSSKSPLTDVPNSGTLRIIPVREQSDGGRAMIGDAVHESTRKEGAVVAL